MFLTSISQICRRDRVEDSVDSILILWILIWTFTLLWCVGATFFGTLWGEDFICFEEFGMDGLYREHTA